MFRQHLFALQPYPWVEPVEVLSERSGVPIERLAKLDANENLYGCSPRVLHALGKCETYHIYPDPIHRELREDLEKYVGVDREHIAIGNGSNELIDLILRLFLDPGDKVVNAVPSFAMFPFHTLVCGGETVAVPRDEDYNIVVPATKAAIDERTKIVFVATPNNPTGNTTPKDDIMEFVATGKVVVVDEAYYEFSGETVADLVPKYDNLIVLRSFSKWAGIAGLRVGYGIFPKSMFEFIYRMKMPYNVNVAALVAARESLADIDFLMEKVRLVIKERELMFNLIKEQGLLKPYPSQANFIFCAASGGRGKQIKQGLDERGVFVRYFDMPLLRDSLRIGVGLPEHTDALMEALGKVCQGV